MLVLIPKLGLHYGFWFCLAHHFGWKVLAILVLVRWNLRLNLSAILATGAIAYLTVVVERWRWTRSLLGTLKSKVLVDALEFHRGEFLLRGQQRVVTVMFSDIRDFSDFCSRHSAEAVVKLLNAYFTAIVPIVEEHQGLIDQYAGDGIKVVFNALDDLPNHQIRAVQAAVRMVQCAKILQESFAHSHDFPNFRIGVGLYTGDVIVGAVGSPRRLDYTAIGDSVNAAARIESENKKQGSEILISAKTYAALEPAERIIWGCQPAGIPVEVKGVGRLEVHCVEWTAAKS
jgi:adenylate cyclase